jgi:hypothetical protein
MGRAKQDSIEFDEKIQAAIRLSISAGAIEECAVHDGTYIDTMAFSDPKELAAEILAGQPDAIEKFESQEEFEKCLQEALNSAGEVCPSCEKNRNS